MPNWVRNRLRIIDDNYQDIINRITTYKNKEDGFQMDFEKIIPMPESIRNTESSTTTPTCMGLFINSIKKTPDFQKYITALVLNKGNFVSYSDEHQERLIEEMIKNNERFKTKDDVLSYGKQCFDNLVNFIENANNPKGLNIGSRHITVSTCGIVPKIYEFSHLKYQVNLAISLHAPNNELRDKLMPINKVYPLEELIKAVKYYIEKTNRRVTFEYILLSEINDGEKEARELVKLIKGLNAYINLIPYNQGNSNNFKRTKNENIMKFYDIIKKEKINVTVRREFGSTISAACGQLRSKKEE